MDYPFLPDGGRSTGEKTTKDRGVKRWSLGEHQETDTDSDWDDVEDSIQNIEDAAPGLAEALSEAKDTVQTFKVGGYECPVCGLNHSHSDDKHDIRDDGRDGLHVTEEFAEQMKFCPFCHCGVSELARLVMYFTEIESVPMFKDQHEFESVLELPTPTVRNVFRAMQEVTIEEAAEDYNMRLEGPKDRKLDMSEAIEWERRRTGIRENPVPADIRPDLRKFYERVRRIRGAASSAPIPSDTEQELNKDLGEL